MPSGHTDAKIGIDGRNAVKTAHDAGQPWVEGLAIGCIVSRMRIADRTHFETLLVPYVIRAVVTVAAESGR